MTLSIKGLVASTALAVFAVSAANAAAPVITKITISYGTTAPTSITIAGSGLCGSPCAKPTVTLSGTSLTVGTYTSTSVAATLPTGTVDAQYVLVLTAGTSGSATQPLAIAATQVSVGTTKTGAPGTAASVAVSGTEIAPVLTFTIPQGATGATGPQGPPGKTGATGPPGPGLTMPGSNNTGGGNGALASLTTGIDNSAFGSVALTSDTTGSYNDAVGAFALELNTSGNGNDAFGNNALSSNSTGTENDAFGYGALTSNTSGYDNVSFGALSLQVNSTGWNNAAVGTFALQNTTTGDDNTSLGAFSMRANTTGTENVAVGSNALNSNTTGSYNIAIGQSAGALNNAGSNNVDIANPGASSDSGVIRIGRLGSQNSTFIAGITGVQTGLTGAAVVVDANGQLGTISSSRRYKQDIEPMADASNRLFQLRPVRFRYIKPDENGNKPIQYGLIAEEVAKVFPELVVYNKDGQPETVAYHLLPGLLLNELQKEHEKVEAATAQLAADRAELASERKELDAMKLQVAEFQQLKQQLADFQQTARELRAQQAALGKALTRGQPGTVQRVSQLSPQLGQLSPQ